MRAEGTCCMYLIPNTGEENFSFAFKGDLFPVHRYRQIKDFIMMILRTFDHLSTLLRQERRWFSLTCFLDTKDDVGCGGKSNC